MIPHVSASSREMFALCINVNRVCWQGDFARGSNLQGCKLHHKPNVGCWKLKHADTRGERHDNRREQEPEDAVGRGGREEAHRARLVVDEATRRRGRFGRWWGFQVGGAQVAVESKVWKKFTCIMF